MAEVRRELLVGKLMDNFCSCKSKDVSLERLDSAKSVVGTSQHNCTILNVTVIGKMAFVTTIIFCSRVHSLNFITF
jgi:hypothetical protein